MTPTTPLTEWGWLDVVASLSWQMTLKGSETVAKDVGVPVVGLLAMIDGSRAFNRNVLRYLGYKRITRYRYQKR